MNERYLLSSSFAFLAATFFVLAGLSFLFVVWIGVGFMFFFSGITDNSAKEGAGD